MILVKIPVIKAALSAFFLFTLLSATVFAEPLLTTPPLGEKCFAILTNDEKSGFACQKISSVQNGYLVESFGSTNMKIMGFTREAVFYEQYNVDLSLKLQSFRTDQRIKGKLARLSGEMQNNGLQVLHKANGKETQKLLTVDSDLFPAPLLNLLPLMQAEKLDEYQFQFFDPEDLKIKNVEVSDINEETDEDGQQFINMENDLYPFVSNEIRIDKQGNTLLESVRDGLVVTVPFAGESFTQLAGFVADDIADDELVSFGYLKCMTRLKILK